MSEALVRYPRSESALSAPESGLALSMHPFFLNQDRGKTIASCVVAMAGATSSLKTAKRSQSVEEALVAVY